MDVAHKCLLFIERIAARQGGNLVDRIKVGQSLIFTPSHNIFILQTLSHDFYYAKEADSWGRNTS